MLKELRVDNVEKGLYKVREMRKELKSLNKEHKLVAKLNEMVKSYDDQNVSPNMEAKKGETMKLMQETPQVD